MEELKAEQDIFLQLLLSLHYDTLVLTPCSCGSTKRVRKVGCSDCLQAELLCPQCWLDKHRTMPTHWALVWNAKDRFFEKHDFSRVMKNAAISLGHYGQPCPKADLARSFTLVDSNGIHATCISFCRCPNNAPDFQQLLRAGIFPGSVKEPKTGYTLRVLEFYHQLRNQGKGSAYNFVLVLQRLADPFFADSVPDIYINFLAITRFHRYLDIIMRRGHAHRLDDPLPGERDRPYPNRPVGFLGLQCAACPERGVNMPLTVNESRHLVSQHLTLDGNFKANLFYKRDDGSDTALTDGKMYFPSQTEFDGIAESYVPQEVPCKAHIGSIRHQGQVKYGNTAVSGVVACACDHAVAGSFIDMLKGEAFALGTYAQREQLRHTNSPPHGPETATPTVFSYDSWCSFVVNEVPRAEVLFPEEEWLHTLLAKAEGQIPADHINGHGSDCQAIWQPVYFGCRGHFHGETAEMLWAFLNPLGSSTRQMTGAARHDAINCVMDAWNMGKVVRQAKLLAAERLDALRLFELHMAVVEDLSRQHPTEVAVWSRMSRDPEKTVQGIRSVYQHERLVLTIENTLASMLAEEREKSTRGDGQQTRTPVAEWIHKGMNIERQKTLAVALLKSHQDHPLEETWKAITKIRDSLNLDLKKFREQQRAIYQRLKLSALDVDEPELTAIQLPSYRMKHGQRAPTSVGASNEDMELREAEIKLRCGEANSGILAVRAASLALSAVKQVKDLDYRGQPGKSRRQRNLQKAELVQTFEIDMYNQARAALINLGHITKDSVEPYPPLSHRDTRRKETHLHRAKGDSRLFDGTAWYLQSGGASSASEAEDSDVNISPTKHKRRLGKHVKKKKKGKKSDGWIWLEGLTRGQHLGDESKLAEYKKESDRVQWFRAEAEMYRWLELYERKHAELIRTITRYRRDSEVWAGLADREEGIVGVNGSTTFARMQAAMYKRLEHNAKLTFKNAESGAHQDWVGASTFDELVIKVDRWRDAVFKWMDEMVSEGRQHI
ncbi:hypothetical protein GGX14DRAFT_352357 [Mycena pura]|uniref:CxC2-like cysteine cluster KDZ transposase-associated domain-containing protein n=1 Tax=Mycena pura TaxID=153505 RepID=A0AAD6V4K3_9AGAR|nr:hypothetical protein GGX14DRAFT_370363 [Mycena pura]KAJ7223356.1 hypothetical protein GGX14DRAFT_352357 [Mycena pura]